MRAVFVFGLRNRGALGPKRSRMPRTKTRADSALEIWDYFYIHNGPAPGDEKVWGVIGRDNRTLEVRGSIPLGSTRKRSRRVEIRGDFVFAPPANRSPDLEVASDPARLPR